MSLAPGCYTSRPTPPACLVTTPAAGTIGLQHIAQFGFRGDIHGWERNLQFALVEFTELLVQLRNRGLVSRRAVQEEARLKGLGFGTSAKDFCPRQCHPNTPSHTTHLGLGVYARAFDGAPIVPLKEIILSHPIHPLSISIVVQPLDLIQLKCPFARPVENQTYNLDGTRQTSIVAGCAVIGTPYPRTCCWKAERAKSYPRETPAQAGLGWWR